MCGFKQQSGELRDHENVKARRKNFLCLILLYAIGQFRFLLDQFSVLQNLDNAICRINIYPLDNTVGFPNTYPLDCDQEQWPLFRFILKEPDQLLGPARAVSRRNFFFCLVKYAY